MRLELFFAQRGHQPGFADILRARAGCDLLQQRFEPLADRAVEQPVEHFRAAPGAVAQEIREIEDRAEEILDLAPGGKKFREPCQAAFLSRLDKLGKLAPRGGRIEGRQFCGWFE